jgi:Carbohydrate binding domain
MAVGLPLKTTYADGDVYSASDVNDTNGTVNLVGQTNNFYAGKNKIINGDFGINQRNISSATGTNFVFDRFVTSVAGDGTSTSSAQTFTAGAAPVAGYEAVNYLRIVTTGQTATNCITRLDQKVEDARTFAGQTVTVSFWAQAGSGAPSIAVELQQNFGTGGSPSATVNTIIASPAKQTISTSWSRYSFTISVPSISSKTFGTDKNSFLNVGIWISAGTDFNARTGSLGIQTNTFDIWGVQLESGSTATAFQTATGTIQGELAACQRYYRLGYFDVRLVGAVGGAYSFVTTSLPMRITPTSAFTAAADYSNNISGTPQVLTNLSATIPNISLRFSTTGAGDTFYGRPYELAAEL